jgi:hypothetical protein
LRGVLGSRKLEALAGVLRVHHQRNAFRVGHGLLQELKTLADEVEREQADARHVPAWPRVAPHDPSFDRVRAQRKHDRQVRLVLENREQREAARREDEVRAGSDNVRHDLRDAVRGAVAGPYVDRNVAAFDVTERFEAGTKRVEVHRRRILALGRDVCDAIGLALRSRKRGAGATASIRRSARRRTLGGMITAGCDRASETHASAARSRAA